MKIAIVTATFPPYRAGTGNVAYHHARLLDERGYGVTVLTAAQRTQDLMPSFPFDVRYLPPTFRLGNAPLTPRLYKELKGFDIVHLHYPYIFGAELVRLITKKSSTPLVVSYHNRLEEQQWLKSILFAVYNKRMEPWILQGADIVTPVSTDHFMSLHRNWRDQSRIVEIPNGVDVDAFTITDRAEARRALRLPADKALVLFAGALDRAHRFKDVPSLLRALTTLPDYVQLIIAGDGETRTSLEQEAAGHKLNDRVRFVGALAPSELAVYYNASDVTALPSSGVESFGLVLVESMACGTPVIATDLPGVRTVVPQGAGGWLVPPGDSNSLARSIQSALDIGIRTEDRQKLREWATSRFSWEIAANHYETVYRRIIGPDQ